MYRTQPCTLHSLHLGANTAPELGDFPQIRASDSRLGLVFCPTAPVRAVMVEESWLDCALQCSRTPAQLAVLMCLPQRGSRHTVVGNLWSSMC